MQLQPDEQYHVLDKRQTHCYTLMKFGRFWVKEPYIFQKKNGAKLCRRRHPFEGSSGALLLLPT